jgi:cytochrome b
MTDMAARILRIWDLPTRIFHWLLVLAVAGAVLTGELAGDLFVWHGRFGVVILGLLIFRLVWGVAGSTYVRFSHFIPSARTIREYRNGAWRGAGHNPLGALSVLGMLLFLLLQAGTGLFANNHESGFKGPLFDLVGKALSHDFSEIHEFLFNITLALLILHVAAIAYYVRIKKKMSLVPAMITGNAEVDDDSAQPAHDGSPLALIVALALAVGAVWLIGSGSLVALLS